MSGNGLKARLIRGGLGSAGIQAANRLLALALGIFLARMLGVEGYGIYAYAFAIMTLLMVAAEAGVPTLLMREVAASKGRAEWGLLRGAIHRGMQFAGVVAVSISLFGLLVLRVVADNLEYQALNTLVFMLLVLPIAALCKTVEHAIRGLDKVVIGQVMNLLLRPLIVLLFVGVSFIMFPGLRQPQYAMAAQLIAASVVLLVAVQVLRHFIPSKSRAVAPEYRDRDWFRSALPFTLIAGALVIRTQTDIVMLGWFATSEDVGIYRVAVQVATLVAFGLQVVNAVVAPQFSRLSAQGDMEQLQRLVTQATRLILVIALPVALVLFLAGGEIISWLFGAEFVDAYIPLTLLVVGQLVLAMVGSSGSLLSMTGFESIVSKVIWISALVNVFLNVLLIPSFGMIGAAASTLITMIGWNVSLFFVARNCLGVSVAPWGCFRGLNKNGVRGA